MPSTVNYQALEPAPDHLSTDHAPRNVSSLAHNSSASLSATQGPSSLQSTSEANAQFAQADLSEKSTPRSKEHDLEEAGLWSRLIADWWILELAAALVSLAALASVFGVLMAYDQKPVPSLDKGITVRAPFQFSTTTRNHSPYMRSHAYTCEPA